LINFIFEIRNIYIRINLDELVNILDIILVENIILGDYEVNELELWLADLNLDGAINILDIIVITNIILTL